MVTIKQALTNTHGAALRRTLKDIKVGEAFKWKEYRHASPRDNVWCVRVADYTNGLVVSSVLTEKRVEGYLWMPLEGDFAGMLYVDSGNAEIHQP